MNGAMNRRVLILLGPVAGIVMFLGVVWMASVFVGHNEYKEPYRAPAATADATPRAEGVAAEKAAAETKAKATPYTEAEYLAAERAGVPTLMFVAHDSFPVPAFLIESDEMRQRLKAFRDRVLALNIT